jgi:hypothetical protein
MDAAELNDWRWDCRQILVSLACPGCLVTPAGGSWLLAMTP